MQKWYNELLFDGKTLKSKDGLSSLLDLFANEADFIKHFIENTVFFKKEHIETIRQALAGVAKQGTSARVFVGAGYESGGKTGTAQAVTVGQKE
ncbi:MAG: penicillin-binding transpeptidase domain-containing protein, partial [Weeksellaceae bacterium]